MNKTRLLWLLVAADVLLAFGSVGAQAMFGWTLPPALADSARDRFSRSPGLGETFPLVLMVTATLSAFVGWIGLATFWRPARGIYLFSCATWLLHVLVVGPSVKPSVAALFTDLNAIVGGMIIGLVYFTELARRFEKRVAEPAAPAGNDLGLGRA
jgi:hypothetical protein